MKKVLLLGRVPKEPNMNKSTKTIFEKSLSNYDIEFDLDEIDPSQSYVVDKKYDAVIGLGDLVLPIVGNCNAQLGNAGPRRSDYEFWTNKFKVLQFREAHGYRTQKFSETPFDNCVRKPKIGTGSVGVSYDPVPMDGFYFEEKIKRKLVLGVYGYVDSNGKCHVHTVGTQIPYKNEPRIGGYTDIPAILEYNPLMRDHIKLINEHISLIEELGVHSTIFSTEYIWDGTNYYLIDLNPRISGHVSSQGRLLNGLNCLERESVLNMLGIADVNFFDNWNRTYFTIKTINPGDGTLTNMDSCDNPNAHLWDMPWIGKQTSARGSMSSTNTCHILYVHDSLGNEWNEICNIEKELNLQIK